MGNEENIEKRVKNALASLKVEGMELTEEEMENLMARQRGEITREEFLRKAAEIANKGEKESE